MKRSDLIFRIEEYFACDGVLSHSYPPHEVKFDERHVKMMAQDILEIIEELGMLPPTVLRTTGLNNEIHFIENLWEPEE